MCAGLAPFGQVYSKQSEKDGLHMYEFDFSFTQLEAAN